MNPACVECGSLIGNRHRPTCSRWDALVRECDLPPVEVKHDTRGAAYVCSKCGNRVRAIEVEKRLPSSKGCALVLDLPVVCLHPPGPPVQMMREPKLWT